jgi:aminoglycoside phosphotransferase (APT) family kinase protein
MTQMQAAGALGPIAIQSDMIVIDASLAARLVAAQFPQWADQPVRAVQPQGWDNRTFRLGDAMKLRLPSAAWYAAQVGREHAWLPKLAPHLPVQIPDVIAVGAPGEGYPFAWAVQSWVDAKVAMRGSVGVSPAFARDVAAFLRALWAVDATGGPLAGEANFHRGGSLAVYDGETRAALEVLRSTINAPRAEAVWNAALGAVWEDAPVWVHGDMARGNLLVREGRLAAVIDFGCLAVGDPACDLTVAWTLFGGTARAAFRGALGDDAMWARARGWALWKALITLARDPRDAEAPRVLAGVLEALS